MAPSPKQAVQPNQNSSGDAAEFMLGNVMFILLHELGHGLISEFQLPVLGREEDAVDNFASVLLVPDADDPQGDATILTDAIAGWFASAEMTALEDIAWWGEHGPDQQRAYQIACLLYGSNVGAYDILADRIDLPAERRESCAAEYETVSASWGQLLAPHIVGAGVQPGARISVRYEDAGEFSAEQQMLRESGMLEAMADEMSGTFRLPRPLTMKAARCGEPNAFWEPEAGEITICYELIRDYLELHAQRAG